MIELAQFLDCRLTQPSSASDLVVGIRAVLDPHTQFVQNRSTDDEMSCTPISLLLLPLRCVVEHLE